MFAQLETEGAFEDVERLVGHPMYVDRRARRPRLRGPFDHRIRAVGLPVHERHLVPSHRDGLALSRQKRNALAVIRHGLVSFLSPLPAGLWSPIRILDRKSTRLNSSHANISYAVFCL